MSEPRADAVETTWEEMDPVSLRLIPGNNRLITARKAAGLNQTQLADMVGIDNGRMSHYETLKYVPTLEIQVRIATVLGESLDYLFPEYLMDAVKRGVFNKCKKTLNPLQVVSLTDVKSLGSYGDHYLLEKPDNDNLKRDIADALNNVCDRISNDPKIRERTRKVMILLYGLSGGEPMSRDAVGREFNVTRERIRQVEMKVLQRMRHPIRSKHLVGYLGE